MFSTTIDNWCFEWLAVTVNLIDAQTKESLTVSTVAKTLTSGTYGSNNRAFIQCQDANVRYWLDGSTPTTSEGHILYKGEALELHGSTELTNFKVIRDDSVDAVLAVSYFGKGEINWWNTTAKEMLMQYMLILTEK